MFTRIYYKALALCLFDYSGMNPSVTAKNHLGANCTLNSNMRSLAGNVVNALDTVCTYEKGSIKSPSYFIAFGDGNTPPTIDDYQLSGNHFTTHNSTKVWNYSHTSDEAVMTITYTLTNKGTEAFTIREAGLFSIGGSNINEHKCLVWREVLPSPVTIEPDGVGQVTLTFKVNVPE